MGLEIPASPGQADAKPTPDTTTNNSPTTEPKIYSNDELERLELALSPLEILAQFLKPGVSFSHPPPVLPDRSYDDVPTLCKIGEGNTTTVFEVIEESVVLKKYHETGGDTSKNEPKDTSDIAKGFADYQPRYGIPVKVPEVLDIPGECPEYWKYYWYDYEYIISPIYFNSHSTPAIKMSLMHSVPRIVRRALISHFHPQGSAPMDPCVVDEILHREDNNHCLVHPYLCFETIKRPRGDFSLRDLELSRTEMEKIGMDLENLAATLGDALAFFNFKCERTASMARFAFGASPVNSEVPNGPLAICLHLFHFWYLSKVERTASTYVLENMVRGVSYYIPDCKGAPHLWAIFKTAYIKRGNECQPASIVYTPEEVMKDYEEYAARNYC